MWPFRWVLRGTRYVTHHHHHPLPQSSPTRQHRPSLLCSGTAPSGQGACRHVSSGRQSRDKPMGSIAARASPAGAAAHRFADHLPSPATDFRARPGWDVRQPAVMRRHRRSYDSALGAELANGHSLSLGQTGAAGLQEDVQRPADASVTAASGEGQRQDSKRNIDRPCHPKSPDLLVPHA